MSTSPSYSQGNNPPRDSFPRGNPHDPRQTGYEESQDNPDVTDGPAPQKRRFGCCLGCGIVGLVMVLVCCGGGAYLGDFFLGTLGEEFGRLVASDDAFQEHVGDIKEISPNYRLMLEEIQRAQNADKDPPIVYDVEGTKGSAVLVVTQDSSSSEPAIQDAVLILPDETRIPLKVKVGAGNVNDFQEDIDAMQDMENFIDSGTAETDSPEFDSEGDPPPEPSEEDSATGDPDDEDENSAAENSADENQAETDQ